jgi:hypothetical protein
MVVNPSKGEAARWNMIDVTRKDSCWRLSVHARGITEQGFETLGRWALDVPLSDALGQ